ncbi:MAG: T9SS C-terminal target domain-containing protein, partial [Porphyromonadaceae bacterium]|nr:T9SS C-terminal target domain-containing protein [Porphyromonadaceae bacterium]
MHYLKTIVRQVCLYVITILTIAISPALSQNEYPAIPQSFTYRELPSQCKNIVIAPNQNFEDIKVNQAWSNRNIQTKPLTVGFMVPRIIDFTQEAEAITLDNGKKIYRLNLQGEDAKGIILYYNQFEIPKGGKLFIYSKDKSVVHGAYTEATNPARGHFATSPIMSEHIVMEYEPENNEDEGPHIIISDVGYLFSQATPTFRDNNGQEIVDGEDTSMPNCQINANCPEASRWRKQMAGVCQIYLTMIRDGKKYISACSGTLVNNTKEDYSPLIISAAHCMEDIMKHDNYEEYLDQWVFNFHYMKPGCSNSPSGYGRQVKSMIGCDILTYLPFDGYSDGILLKLKEDIPASYRVFYNGWDRRDHLYKSAISLHHPSGDAMKISFHDGEPQIVKADNGAEKAHFKFH